MGVYDSNLLETTGTNPCLEYLTVTSVGPFTSTLEVPSDTTHQFQPSWYNILAYYCLLEPPVPKKLALYCENGSGLKNVFPPKQEEKLGITIIHNVKCCDLELTVIGQKVHFYCCNDGLITPHIGARSCISHTINIVDELAIQEVVKSFS